MRIIKKYRKGQLYEGEDKKDLSNIISNLSFMKLNNKQKSVYCNLAFKHLGLNVDKIRFNCDRCGIKNCRVKKSVYEFDRDVKAIGKIRLS